MNRFLKKKYFIILLIFIAIVVMQITKSFGMQYYYKVDFQTGLVTATNLYVRSRTRNTI